MHNYNIRNNRYDKLDDLMKYYNGTFPYEWQDINKMSIFDKAYFGIIPDIEGHKSDE